MELSQEDPFAQFWPVQDPVQRAVSAAQTYRAKHPHSGQIEEKRLQTNLLSSQPAAFYLFAPLQDYPALLCNLIRQCLGLEGDVQNPQLFFEFRPGTDLSGDRSAFDVAIFFQQNGQPAFWGLEVKYTEDLTENGQPYGSPGTNNYEAYKSLAEPPEGGPFRRAYDDLIHKKEINQLLRNELLAQEMLQTGEVAATYTGLLHHPEDPAALELGEQFKAELKRPEAFIQLNYSDWIGTVQQQDLNASLRTWASLAWVRYASTELSEHWYAR
jgi:hypothetical protein